MNKKTILLFAIVFLAVPLASSGKVKFNPDNSAAHLTETNVTVNFNLTRNFTAFKVRNDRLTLNDGNLSIKNNSKKQTDVNLYEWNFSKASGETLINFSANSSTGHNVEFEIENLSSDRNHTIKKDGNVLTYEKTNSSGDLVFNNSDWSYHTFTVQEMNSDPSVSLTLGSSEIDPGDSVNLQCSVSDEDGIDTKDLDVEGPESSYDTSCGNDFSETDETGDYTVNLTANDTTGKTASVEKTFEVTSSSGDGGGGGGGSSSSEDTQATERFSKNWVFSNKKNFKAENIKEVKGLSRVDITTDENVSSLGLSIKNAEKIPVNKVENSYSYLEINVTEVSEQEISSVKIEFNVNRSFAEKFDRISALRYENGWKKLPTNLVESEGESWTYRAETEGFSYFTVQGENTATQNEEQDGNETEKRENTCGNQVCEESENETTCPSDCQKSQQTEKTQNNKSATESPEDTVENLNKRKIIAFIVLALLLCVAILTWVKREKIGEISTLIQET